MYGTKTVVQSRAKAKAMQVTVTRSLNDLKPPQTKTLSPGRLRQAQILRSKRSLGLLTGSNNSEFMGLKSYIE